MIIFSRLLKERIIILSDEVKFRPASLKQPSCCFSRLRIPTRIFSYILTAMEAK
jgi:hypothetical protein